MPFEKRKKPGRPPSTSAVSHDHIIQAVYDLLQTRSVYDLTMEEIARHAKVGKPTIYKWWPSKAALVLDMFEERVVPRFAVQPEASAEACIRKQVGELIRLLGGFFGKVSAEIIAEGQCEPPILEEYRKRYLLNRRAVSTEIFERGFASGEFTRRVDPALLIDLVYGPIYYRLLVRHLPLDQAFGEAIVDTVMAALKKQ